MSSPSAQGLSVDPITDTVLAVTKLQESVDSGVSNEPKVASPSVGNTRSSATMNPSSKHFVPPSMNATIEPTPAVVTELMHEMSPIETYATQRKLAVISRSNVPSAVAFVTTPVAKKASSPLQASSHGWKLFDVAWYWWVVGAIGSVYATRRIMHQYSPHVTLE